MLNFNFITKTTKKYLNSSLRSYLERKVSHFSKIVSSGFLLVREGTYPVWGIFTRQDFRRFRVGTLIFGAIFLIIYQLGVAMRVGGELLRLILNRFNLNKNFFKKFN